MAAMYVIAFVLAAVSAGVEAAYRHRVMPLTSDAQTLALVGVGVAFEGAVGCAAAFGLSEVTNLPPAATGLIAGLSASTILRQRFADIGGTGIGVVYFYDRVRGLIQRTVARRAASRYAVWRSATTRCILKADKVQELGKRVRAFVSAKEDEDVNAAAESVTNALKIQAVLDEKETTDEDKLDGLLELAKEFDALVVVRVLYREIEGEPFEQVPRRTWAIVGIAGVCVLGVGITAWLLLKGGPSGPLEGALGQPLRLQRVLYVAQRAETATHVGARTRADGVYVIVKILVGNESSAPVPLDPSHFSVETQNGDIHRPARSPAAVLPDPLKRMSLTPEDRQTGVIAFDVPADELNGLELRIDAPGVPQNGTPKQAGVVDLKIPSAGPPLLKKVFHGGAERGVRISFVTTGRRVSRIAVSGRKRCGFRDTAAVRGDGHFLSRAPTGLLLRGRFLSTVEATGDLVPPQQPQVDPCMTKLKKSVGWTAQAPP
jgi:hypothetical protein